MWNIIKSLNYMIRRDIYTYVVLIVFVFCLIPVTSSIINSIDTESVTGSLSVSFFSDISGIFIIGLPMLVTTRICGYDMNDKTLNYEILYGQKRSSVFFARILLSMIYSIIIFLIFSVLPVALITLKYGWGYSISVREALLHLGLAVLVLIRYTTVIAAITFFARSSWIGLAAAYVMIILEMMPILIFSEFANTELTWQLSLPNDFAVLDFSNTAMGFAEGKDIIILKAALEPSVIIGTIAASVIVSAVMLTGSYILFRKRDID